MKILVNFYANVTETSVNELIKFITIQLAQQKPDRVFDELIIQISSSGGSSDHGLLAYNFLKQISIPKTTIGMGNVDSAAIMIFCAGNKRVAMPSCRFVLHEAMASIRGQFTETKLSEMTRLTQRITNDYVDVVSKVVSKSKDEVLHSVKEGAVLSSEDAKSYGLVTEILEDAYLKEMKDLAILLINNPQQAPAKEQPNKAEV